MSVNPPSTYPASGNNGPRRRLIIVLIVLALVQVAGIIRLIQWPDAPGMWPPVIQASVYGFWAVVAFRAAARLLRRRPRAIRSGLLVLLGFTIYTAIRLVTTVQADYDRGRLPFLLLVIGVVVIGLIAAIIRNQHDTISGK